ncbi:MAG: 2-oxoglutarate dehydrogenase complex dihydrolipoyllysine-residue succinyltransferase [Bacteroidia bacterium]|nr:2-oxoglutarate dehydrogenase complex dihydrolipoyllysine-residue succinyltransferase [Bacteroidia bacterium]MCX7652073.1 2-oxoglutarate dehydrogenase complex dihydrolipoyllysine-residue succinyltransferase [Bacteroidia bacterium]MDW8416941.1 2-oxoglutarate dehydrogenase complex dihydrolipoyllysine-residue succinyltransferase [Bacteroidia bacterium]
MIEIRVPSPGESITEVLLDKWHKPNGSWVEKDELLAEIQSDKAALEVYAEVSGKLEILVQAGAQVPVGSVIARIDPAAEKAADVSHSSNGGVPAQTEAPSVPAEPSGGGHVMPSAARILAEKGISPTQVQGSGPAGRITKADALAAQPGPSSAVSETTSSQVVSTPSATAPPSATTESARQELRKKLTPIRQTIARRLLAAKNQTAMLTTFNEVDMSRILELRKAYKDRFQEKHGIGLGFMSFFTKACATALLEFPEVNSQLHEDELVYFSYVDISVAVSTDRGLVVPVVRNAHLLSLAEIEKAIADLAARARQNKISIEEMQGGTFTITNGGVFGSLLSTPILNPPQTAILGMHKIQERPVAVNGQVAIRPMMYVALSYDHRVIDGKEAVSFLVRVKELLEDPIRLLLAV